MPDRSSFERQNNQVLTKPTQCQAGHQGDATTARYKSLKRFETGTTTREIQMRLYAGPPANLLEVSMPGGTSQDRLIGELVNGDWPRVGQAMTCGHNQEEWVVEEGNALELQLSAYGGTSIIHPRRPLVELEDHCEVELVGAQRGDAFIRFTIAEGELRVGVTLAEDLECFCRECARRAGEGPEAKATVVDSPDDVKLGLRLGQSSDDCLGVFTERSAGVSQLHATSIAVEEEHPGRALKRTHLLRDR